MPALVVANTVRAVSDRTRFAGGTTVGLLEAALTTRSFLGISASEMVKFVTVTDPPAVRMRSGTCVITGGLFVVPLPPRRTRMKFDLPRFSGGASSYDKFVGKTRICTTTLVPGGNGAAE